jgi:hypothetical protein
MGDRVPSLCFAAQGGGRHPWSLGKSSSISDPQPSNTLCESNATNVSWCHSGKAGEEGVWGDGGRSAWGVC